MQIRTRAWLVKKAQSGAERSVTNASLAYLDFLFMLTLSHVGERPRITATPSRRRCWPPSSSRWRRRTGARRGQPGAWHPARLARSAVALRRDPGLAARPPRDRSIPLAHSSATTFRPFNSKLLAVMLELSFSVLCRPLVLVTYLFSDHKSLESEPHWPAERLRRGFPNSYWEPSARWSYAEAALRGTSYLKLPGRMVSFAQARAGSRVRHKPLAKRRRARAPLGLGHLAEPRHAPGEVR